MTGLPDVSEWQPSLFKRRLLIQCPVIASCYLVLNEMWSLLSVCLVEEVASSGLQLDKPLMSAGIHSLTLPSLLLLCLFLSSEGKMPTVWSADKAPASMGPPEVCEHVREGSYTGCYVSCPMVFPSSSEKVRFCGKEESEYWTEDDQSFVDSLHYSIWAVYRLVPMWVKYKQMWHFKSPELLLGVRSILEFVRMFSLLEIQCMCIQYIYKM